MNVTALAGGVGGARLAEGLAQALPPQDLTVIVNTGDDFTHLGLYISPDLDTVCYTLAGLSDPVKGWGRVDESWHAIQELKALGGPAWFNLGDRDLATHLERTRRLAAGQTLSQVTADFCRAWDIRHKVLPMSNQPVSTIVHSEDGMLGFQEYFVARRCEPRVSGFHFEGIESAQPAPGVLQAVQKAELVVICPSNPWVSIDPILALPGIHPALSGKPVVAVSPIIGGATVKGPAAKMFAEMGIQPSALAVREHYGALLGVFVLDQIDLELHEKMSIPTLVTDTIMKTAAHRRRLAEEILSFVKNL
jgi:LPPG:FO 2-phospho-L-lactate transferase